MNTNIVTNLDTCIPSTLSALGGNLGLLYYSHIPIIIISLFFGFFVLLKGNRGLLAKIFFSLTVAFTLWSVLDLFTWLSSNTSVIMFAWALTPIVEISFFILGLYFVYVFTAQGDASLWYKLVAGILLLPVIIMTPTVFNLSNFYAPECYAVESNSMLHYKYFIEIVCFAIIVVFSLVKIKQADQSHRKHLALLSFGVILFLLSFFSAVFLSGYLVENGSLQGYGFEIYGLFGAIIFLGFLAYLIVQFKMFDIKILGTQALVVVLIILIGSQFFYVKTQTNFILTIVTFILVVSAGTLLIRSFKRSEERKEELQIMADRLAVSNERLREMDNTKTEFISIASHQLRTPLTSIKGYCALLLEGTYGNLNNKIEEVVQRIIFSNERLVNLVENLLSISRMEAGRMEYAFEDHHIETILSELYASFAFAAQSKRLDLLLNLPEKPLPVLRLDKQKIQEVFSNLVDNAIKYTNQGSIVISVTQNSDNRKVRVTVKDSGIGIPPSEIPFLFTKFSRGKDVNRLHANGTGLGLYVAKNIVEAHKGKIWIESEGAGKGTSFIVELG